MDIPASGITKLSGVHPDLVKVVHAVAEQCSVPFTVVYGTRTVAEEIKLIAMGRSSLKNPLTCRHVPAKMPDGHVWGRAVDIAPLVHGVPVFDKAFYPLFIKIGEIFQSIGPKLGVPIRSGYMWKTFKDYGHHELPKSLKYP